MPTTTNPATTDPTIIPTRLPDVGAGGKADGAGPAATAGRDIVDPAEAGLGETLAGRDMVDEAEAGDAAAAAGRVPVAEAEAYRWPTEPPPRDDGETLMDLLHRELGAYLISG